MSKQLKHVAVYIRVSSKAQDHRSQTPDLERWADQQSEPVKTYRDKFTGKSMERPGWERLWKEVQAGNVSKVVVWRLDRLGRTASGLTKVFDELIERKVPLVSLKDSIDLSTASGKLMANVLASVAAYENEVRRERIIAGQEVARANGKSWGGSKPGRLLSVTPEQKRQVLAMRGEKVTTIARTVKLSRPTVYRLLEQGK
jgi:DNA invertase Pin-like site-specific DNA recombinase